MTEMRFSGTPSKPMASALADSDNVSTASAVRTTSRQHRQRRRSPGSSRYQPGNTSGMRSYSVTDMSRRWVVASRGQYTRTGTSGSNAELKCTTDAAAQSGFVVSQSARSSVPSGGSSSGWTTIELTISG